MRIVLICFFFFTETAPTEIYTLSLHDALPIFEPVAERRDDARKLRVVDVVAGALDERPHAAHLLVDGQLLHVVQDRKSTRLNSSHMSISYAVFCLKKKKKRRITNLFAIIY